MARFDCAVRACFTRSGVLDGDEDVKLGGRLIVSVEAGDEEEELLLSEEEEEPPPKKPPKAMVLSWR